LSLHGYGRHINSTSPKGVIFMTDEFSVLFQCYCYSFNLWILLAAGTSLLAFYFSCYHIGLEFLTTWRWRVFALKHRLLMFFLFPSCFTYLYDALHCIRKYLSASSQKFSVKTAARIFPVAAFSFSLNSSYFNFWFLIFYIFLLAFAFFFLRSFLSI